MIFTETAVDGAFVIDIEPIEDNRGFFARTWDAGEFARRGLDPAIAQCSISYNLKKGTLRGMHYQTAPHEEAKIVRCLHGAIYDVVLDLRRHSPKYKQWAAVELSADNRRALYIPRGCAHGFQTLTAGAEVLYQISSVYTPGSARGVRWNDPAFGINWPLDDQTMSDRDGGYPDYQE